MIAAKILADSVSPQDDRLTTFLLTMPRCLLAELNTHRMLSRSVASSRAIPVKTRIADVLLRPYIPAFAANKGGMQAGAPLDVEAQSEARSIWLDARDSALRAAEALGVDVGAHKQWSNRLIEPFSYVPVIVTATEWGNFFALRLSKLAQPEFEDLAHVMYAEMLASQPKPITEGQWHLPLAEPDDAALPIEDQVKVCAARCARVSYGNHLQPKGHADLLVLADRLATDRHMSPFEHVATPVTARERYVMTLLAWRGEEELNALESPWVKAWADSILYVGNLRGWISARKMIPGESGRSL